MSLSTKIVATRDSSGRVVNLLLMANVAYAVIFAVGFLRIYLNTDGFLSRPHAPFGDDFVNIWTVGRLLLTDGLSKIYIPRKFMDFQHSFIDSDLGLRLWAYPPHSLLFTWAAGLGGYFTTFWLWSATGLAVLATGARRFGFGWRETAILVLCPASLQCIGNGQSGNIACGLMLFALAGNTAREKSSFASAALLTLKPQTGFLLPLIWLIRRRWSLIAATAVATVVLVGLSLLLFGIEPWRDYIGSTLPDLSQLERGGSGPFVFMIPSLFMALRILGLDGDTALFVHVVLAVGAVTLLGIRLRHVDNPKFQAGLVLIATCLTTPYLHIYDLSILLAGALTILGTVHRNEGPHYFFAILAVAIAWILPRLVEPLGLAGLPLSPVLIGLIFATACFSFGREPVVHDGAVKGLADAPQSL